jgi:hypothetical protein
MSASARTDMSLMETLNIDDMSLMETLNKTKIFWDSAVENFEKGRYLSAYKEYSKALKCLTEDDVDREPIVNVLRTDIKNNIKKKMDDIGKLHIFDVRLNFIEIDPHAFDPFCMCSNGRAHDHWCDFCTRGKTVLDLYRWEQTKLEREVSLANLVKLKRERALALLERSNKLRKQMELLDEELRSTMSDVWHAKQELEESRGW